MSLYKLVDPNGCEFLVLFRTKEETEKQIQNWSKYKNIRKWGIKNANKIDIEKRFIYFEENFSLNEIILIKKNLTETCKKYDINLENIIV